MFWLHSWTRLLGDTIKYLKQLEEYVKILEEEVATRTVESVIFAKKPSLQRGDGVICLSSDEKSYNPLIDQQLPEVEARVLGTNVLIKVHCEKHEGCIKEVMKQMEDMNLTTLNISVLAFGSSLLDITIVAQIENENCLTLEEIVEKLHDALTMFIGSSSKCLQGVRGYLLYPSYYSFLCVKHFKGLMAYEDYDGSRTKQESTLMNQYSLCVVHWHGSSHLERRDDLYRDMDPNCDKSPMLPSYLSLKSAGFDSSGLDSKSLPLKLFKSRFLLDLQKY